MSDTILISRPHVTTIVTAATFTALGFTQNEITEISDTIADGLLMTTAGVLSSTPDAHVNWNTAYAERGSQIAGTSLTWNGTQLDVTDAANWNTAYTERGSQIAGTALTWDGTELDVDDVFVHNTGGDVMAPKLTISDSASLAPLNLTERSAEPSAPLTGDIYLDDGSNTVSGDPGLRHYTGAAWEDISGGGGGDNDKVGVDALATPDYLGNASTDGVLRTSSPLTWTDGGDYITLGLDDSVYALLAGRAGGQSLTGGTAASENLSLLSTSHATKGNVLFGDSDAFINSTGTYCSDDAVLSGNKMFKAGLTSTGSGEALICVYKENGNLSNFLLLNHNPAVAQAKFGYSAASNAGLAGSYFNFQPTAIGCVGNFSVTPVSGETAVFAFDSTTTTLRTRNNFNGNIQLYPDGSGGIRCQPETDSVTFFQVLDADGGVPVLNVDVTNERVGIGTAAPATQLDVVGAITFHERTADPADPAEGSVALWMSDGTGSGDDGDILLKVTAGAVTKTITLVDFSAF